MKTAELEWAPGYVFCENGEIIGPRGKPIRGKVNTHGYRQVAIYGLRRTKDRYVNRLIAEAFHGLPPSDRYHAAHIDGDSLNNAASNLRWATPKENEADKKKHGTVSVGEKNGWTYLTEDMVRQMRVARDSGLSFRLIAIEHGVCRSTAFNVCKGITWGHIT